MGVISDIEKKEIEIERLRKGLPLDEFEEFEDKEKPKTLIDLLMKYAKEKDRGQDKKFIEVID